MTEMALDERMATDPPVSERQRRAMFAAAEGRSTLRIPRNVGREFVGKDASTSAAGVAFITPGGDVLFVRRAGADHPGEWCFPGGTVEDGEVPEDTAAREAEEETGRRPAKIGLLDRATNAEGVDFSTFVHGVSEIFLPKLNAESSAFSWAPIDAPPEPLHPGVRATLDAIAREAFAQDQETLSFDRASVREYDADGRLHVALTPISKANVCEYYGREIPRAEEMGLDPARKYRLLRHPDELRKAVDTFNNLPLLRRHVPVSAANHQPGEVVGSTGTDAVFAHPYLMNSLVVWVKDDIEDVESDLKKELSSGYRYRADMTPGDYEGEPYDGIMRDIVGNHVAIVRAGRAGSDVVIGDSKESLMDKIVLTRKAAMVQGGLTAYLRPKLAADAKIDLSPLLADVTAKNYPTKRADIAGGVSKLVTGKLAKDAKLDDLGSFLMAFDEEKPEEEEKKAKDADLPEPGGGKGKGPGGEDRKAKDRKARDEERESLKERIKDGKATDEDWKALDAMMSRDAERDKEDERPDPEKTNDKAKDRKARDEEKDKAEDKKAMDAAIDSAVVAERKRQQGVREAERFVRPWVGDFAIACDTAEDVYKAALEHVGRDVKDVHPSAYKTILEMVPKPGSERPSQVFAHDSANSRGFAERFPDAMKVRIGA